MVTAHGHRSPANRAVAPKPMEFLTVEMIKTTVGGVKRRKQSALYMLKAWRWAGMEQTNTKSFAKVTNNEKYFNFCPYIFTLLGIAELPFFGLYNQ